MKISQSSTQFKIEQRFRTRIFIFTGLFLTVAAVCVFQLINLQVVQGYENSVLAKKFVSRQEFTAAPRGFIYDRSMDVDQPLVQNIHYIDYNIVPARFASYEEGLNFIKRFAAITGTPLSDYQELTSKTGWKNAVRKNKAVTLITRLSRRQQERLAEFQLDSSVGQFTTNHLRYYSMGPALAHVTGYIGLPSRRELDLKLALPYQMLGKDGIEAVYDAELRGTDGIRVRHRILDSEEQISRSEQGNHLILNIQREVQGAGYRALTNSGRRGAAVAIRPATGEIVAMVSTPTFDPNILSSGSGEVRAEHIEKVRDHKAFLNLGIQTKFPPASTLKPLVALAALETSDPAQVNEHLEYKCPGRWTLKSTLKSVPDSVFYCHQASGHGTNDMIGAIAHSCNVYFYQLGYKIGPTPIIEFSRAFGLDKKTGIDLPGEVQGFVPDQRWKQITWSSRWYDGDTINLSIGQGFMEVTPIALAMMISGLVNEGRMMKPHILHEVRDPVSNRVIRKVRPEVLRTVRMSPAHADVVKRGMRAVITEGTGRYLNQPNIVPIAGKTGTAQTRSTRTGRDHAWFVGFAPFGAPPEDQLVVAVFVEYGIAGSASAAPVALEMFKAAYPDYQGPEPPPVRPHLHPDHNQIQIPRQGFPAGVNQNPPAQNGEETVLDPGGPALTQDPDNGTGGENL